MDVFVRICSFEMKCAVLVTDPVTCLLSVVIATQQSSHRDAFNFSLRVCIKPVSKQTQLGYSSSGIHILYRSICVILPAPQLYFFLFMIFKKLNTSFEESAQRSCSGPRKFRDLGGHHAKTDLPIVSLSNKTHAHAGKIDAEDVKGRWRAWYIFALGHLTG